jgi:hypothetical protein
MSAYEINAVTPMQDFPIADRDTAWDADAAEAAIRIWTRAIEQPTIAYAACFFWHDVTAPELFGSYRLPYCDVLGDRITVVPNAIFDAAALLDGARGRTLIPNADQEEVKAVVAEWHVRMAIEFEDPAIVTPWEREARL